MKTKTYNSGDFVEIKTTDKIWRGVLLESYDSEIILLKLESGYNIGIREDKILSIKILKKKSLEDKKNIQIRKNKDLKNIVLIITGGTISSRLDPKTGGVISTDEEEILNLSPQIKDICNIVKIEKPFMKFSEDMSFLDWKKLTQVCEKYLNDSNIDGIVITHGTDFLHYTSAYLSFSIKNLNKPIALTYSQRSIDRASSDASLNLVCACKYATSEIAEIVLVGHENLNDEFCLALPANKVRKMHTSRRDTFKPINTSPIARISLEHLEVLSEFKSKDKNNIVKIDPVFSDKVAVIKIVPGQNPDILDYYLKEGYKGLILEVAGIGQVPGQNAKYNWASKLKKVIDKGIYVFAVSQTIYGRLNPNIYSSARQIQKTGVVYLEDMLSETAFIKLSWVLGHKSWYYDFEKVKEKMLENISGEFNLSMDFDI